MNVLHLNDKVENSGGVEVYLMHLDELLPDYDVQSYWLGLYEAKGQYQFKTYKKSNEKTTAKSFETAMQYIDDFIQQNNIDLVHIHSLSNPAVIKYLFKKIPVVRSMHEPRMFCPGQGKFWRNSERICNKPFGLHCFINTYKEGCCNRHPKRVIKAYQNTAFETKYSNHYKKIFVMSEYMRRESVLAGISDSNLSLNPYFTHTIEAPDFKKEKNNNKQKILFVGRLSITKGVANLLNAFNLIMEKDFKDKIELHIVGDGIHANIFHDKVKHLNIQDHVKFHGWKKNKEIGEFISSSKVVVFPSIYPEAFGIVGIEAMMRGIPVVGFDVGGVSTWLHDGETGYLVEPKNDVQLAEKLEKLLSDKETHQQFSKNAYQIAIEKFSPSCHLNELVEVYKNAVLN